MATYNNARQIAAGATAEITGHDSSYDYAEMSIVDAIAAADNTNVIVTGTVVKINTAYSSSYNNISITISDDEGNQLDEPLYFRNDMYETYYKIVFDLDSEYEDYR